MKVIERVIGGIPVFETVMEEGDYASQDLIDERLNTCKSCEFIVNSELCSKCNCLVLHRTKYVELFCPEGKW